jgi:hypothetical protein
MRLPDPVVVASLTAADVNGACNAGDNGVEEGGT